MVVGPWDSVDDCPHSDVHVFRSRTGSSASCNDCSAYAPGETPDEALSTFGARFGGRDSSIAESCIRLGRDRRVRAIDR